MIYPLVFGLNRLVIYAAPKVAKAPIKRHTPIPFGLLAASLMACFSASPCSSALFPGSRIEKTTQEIRVARNCGMVQKRLSIPRYTPAVSPVVLVLSRSLSRTKGCFSSSRSRSRWLRWRILGDSGGEEVSMLLGRDARRCADPLVCAPLGMERRLTSTPMNVNGAQQDKVQGIPQIEISMVAILTERTNGARHIVHANKR